MLTNQATMLTNGVEQGRHLLNGTLNSLAQELEEMSQAQVCIVSPPVTSPASAFSVVQSVIPTPTKTQSRSQVQKHTHSHRKMKTDEIAFRNLQFESLLVSVLPCV